MRSTKNAVFCTPRLRTSLFVNRQKEAAGLPDFSTANQISENSYGARMKILIKYRTNCNNRLNLSICNLMKFIYITKPLPFFNTKFRENSGNPSSMFIYKKTGYKEKLRLLYSASFGQKMRSFVSECRLWSGF